MDRVKIGNHIIDLDSIVHGEYTPNAERGETLLVINIGCGQLEFADDEARELWAMLQTDADGNGHDTMTYAVTPEQYRAIAAAAMHRFNRKDDDIADKFKGSIYGASIAEICREWMDGRAEEKP